MNLYVNQETLETTTDWAVVEEWGSAGINVSIYQKVGER